MDKIVSLLVDKVKVSVEKFISETGKSFFSKIIGRIKQKKFFNKLESDIQSFLSAHESELFISGVMVRFFDYHNPINRILEYIVQTNPSESEKTFKDSILNEFSKLAKEDGIVISIDDNRNFQELINIIYSESKDYLEQCLSKSERIQIARNEQGKNEILEKDEINTQRIIDTILKNCGTTINAESVLSEEDSCKLFDFLAEKMWKGSFEETDVVIRALGNSNSELTNALKCLRWYMTESGTNVAINSAMYSKLWNKLIKNLIPLLFFRFRKIDISVPEDCDENIKQLIVKVNLQHFSEIFGEERTIENGTELRGYHLDKSTIKCDKWIINNLFVTFASDLRVATAGEIVRKVKYDNWLDNLVEYECDINYWGYNRSEEISLEKLGAIIEALLSQEQMYLSFAHEIQCVFYRSLVKALYFADDERFREVINRVPDNLLEDETLKNFLIISKINNNELTSEEVFIHCTRENNFDAMVSLVALCNEPEDAIDLLEKHIEVLDADPRLFFLYINALEVVGNLYKAQQNLNSHAKQYSGYFEYWNELMKIDTSDAIKNKFVEACKQTQIAFLNRESEYLIIQRLLVLKEYDCAEKYVSRFEMQGIVDNRIKRFKAIISQGKEHDLEALELFISVFNAYRDDAYVVDSILTLSLLNNRSVGEEVISAAKNIGSSRLFMLVANVYKAQGKISDCRRFLMKSILRSSNSFNPAMGQFVMLESQDTNSSIVQINGTAENTAAYIQKKDGGNLRACCIYSDDVVDSSPCFWNGDIHIGINDAARFNILRKKIGDELFIDGETYIVREVIPLDAYYFRTCMQWMINTGNAKAYSVPTGESQSNAVEGFWEWVKDNTFDQKESFDWFAHNNDLSECPLPLYMYNRFVSVPLTQFVLTAFDSPGMMIRESCPVNVCQKIDGYVLSFSTLLMLFYVNVPIEILKQNNVIIPESMKIQVVNDCKEIIAAYNRDTVASMGIYDGRPFVNEATEEEKQKWLNKAGELIRYCEEINTLRNVYELKGPFWDNIEAKEILGICDYDAVAIAKNKRYALVSLEAFTSSFADNKDTDIPTVRLSQMLFNIKIPYSQIAEVTMNITRAGCICSVDGAYVNELVNLLNNAEVEKQHEILHYWDEVLKKFDELVEPLRTYAIDFLCKTFSDMQSTGKLNANIMMFRVFMANILRLKRMQIQVSIDAEGKMNVYLYQMLEDDLIKNEA